MRTKQQKPWTSKAPTPMTVVRRVTESDNLSIVGRGAGKYVTEYSYRDPVYDGRQREFRGFREAVAKKIGDENSPTSSVRSVFLLGECRDEVSGDGVDACAAAERWRDNPREALKGLPYLTETYDENGVYLSTTHQTYMLRHLYTGLDGRAVRHAFVSGTDSFLMRSRRTRFGLLRSACEARVWWTISATPRARRRTDVRRARQPMR